MREKKGEHLGFFCVQTDKRRMQRTTAVCVRVRKKFKVKKNEVLDGWFWYWFWRVAVVKETTGVV